jgi:hypothetical protein
VTRRRTTPLWKGHGVQETRAPEPADGGTLVDSFDTFDGGVFHHWGRGETEPPPRHFKYNDNY